MIGFTSQTKEAAEELKNHYPVVLLGFHRGARSFIDRLDEMAPDVLKKILVIDFNLEVLIELNDRNVKGMFGDISSMDTLEHAHVAHAEVILSTIPDMLLKGTNNQSMVTTCRAIAPNAVIVATADSVDQVEILKTSGANEVLLPYALIGDHLAQFVVDACRSRES
jgi:voltage-gated potassium channel Kch